MNLGRIGIVAQNVFWEVIRDRILYLIGFYALFLLGSIRLIPEVASTTSDKMLLDFGLAGMSILGLIVAVFVGAGLINKEIDKRTIYVLISKPMSQSEFIIGKHLGITAVISVLIAAMTAIYLAILTLSQIPYPSLESLLIAAVFMVFELSLVAAVAILFGVFLSTILATLIAFGVYFMGHLSPDMMRLNQLVDNPGFQRITTLIYLIFPDLSKLDLKNVAVYGLGALPEPQTLALNLGYGVVYIILLLAIAIAIFSVREF